MKAQSFYNSQSWTFFASKQDYVNKIKISPLALCLLIEEELSAEFCSYTIIIIFWTLLYVHRVCICSFNFVVKALVSDQVILPKLAQWHSWWCWLMAVPEKDRHYWQRCFCRMCLPELKDMKAIMMVEIGVSSQKNAAYGPFRVHQITSSTIPAFEEWVKCKELT